MKVIDFIYCDDIRSEIGNKITIVGAYNDKIEFQPFPEKEIKWPISIRLSLYIRLLPEKQDDFDEIEISIKLKDKEIINLKAKKQGDDKEIHPIVLSFVAPGLGIDGPGNIISSISLLKNKQFVETFVPEVSFSITVKE